PQNLAAITVNAKDVAAGAAVGDRGQENALAADDGRGPGLPGNVGLPGDMLRGAPLTGQVLFGGDALTGGAAEAGPVLGAKRGDNDDSRQECWQDRKMLH